MGDKRECPVCRTYTSGVELAFMRDEPCPQCGLSAAAAVEILDIRSKRANDVVTQAFEELRVKLDKAERDRDKYFDLLEQVRAVVEVDLSNL